MKAFYITKFDSYTELMRDNILLLTSTTSCLQMIILLSILSRFVGWRSEVECITLIYTGP